MDRHRRLSRDSLHCLPSKTERDVVILLGAEMRPPSRSLVCPERCRLPTGRDMGQAAASFESLDGVPHWSTPKLLFNLLIIAVIGN